MNPHITMNVQAEACARRLNVFLELHLAMASIA
jgi:hypothetical protein